MIYGKYSVHKFLVTRYPIYRRKEITRIKKSNKTGHSFAFLCHNINDLEHSNQVNLPRVSVVMPLKGFGEHNLHNWRTQVIIVICENLA